MFKPQDTLDRAFQIGIIAKGLNGLAELVGGLLLLFVGPGDIHHLVAMLTQGELSEDPNDVIARYLLHTADGLTGSALLFGAAYLLLHGAVKVGLVIALLLNKLWAYPCTITVLLIFIGYQLYRIALQPSVGLIALTVFDAVIVVLTWREYRRRRRIPDRSGHHRQRPTAGAGTMRRPATGRPAPLLMSHPPTPLAPFGFYGRRGVPWSGLAW
jgi:uncharacterized membrane protein